MPCQQSVKSFGIKSFSTQLVNYVSSPNLHYITKKQFFTKNVKTHLWEKLLAVDQDDYIYF